MKFLTILMFISLAALNMASESEDNKVMLEYPKFTHNESLILKSITLVGSFLSMLGTGFIIFTYWYFPTLRTMLYKLIVYLSISDFLVAVAHVLGDWEDTFATSYVPGTMCYVTAGMTQWFSFSNFLWTACIAFHIYMVLCADGSRKVKYYEKYYNFVAWVIPFFIMVIVGYIGAFGDAGNWCWLKEDYELTRFVFFFLPLVVVFVYDAVVYTIVMQTVSGTNQESQIAFRLRLYLAVFLLTRIPSLLNRFQNFLAPDQPIFFLYLLQSILDPLQGFANCLVYGFNSMVVREWRSTKIYKSCCSNKYDHSTIHEPLTVT